VLHQIHGEWVTRVLFHTEKFHGTQEIQTKVSQVQNEEERAARKQIVLLAISKKQAALITQRMAS